MVETRVQGTRVCETSVGKLPNPPQSLEDRKINEPIFGRTDLDEPVNGVSNLANLNLLLAIEEP